MAKENATPRFVLWDGANGKLTEGGMYRILVIGKKEHGRSAVIGKWLHADAKLCDGREYELPANQIAIMNWMPCLTPQMVQQAIAAMTICETGKYPLCYFSCDIEPIHAKNAFHEVWKVDANRKWTLIHGDQNKAHENPSAVAGVGAAAATKS